MPNPTVDSLAWIRFVFEAFIALFYLLVCRDWARLVYRKQKIWLKGMLVICISFIGMSYIVLCMQNKIEGIYLPDQWNPISFIKLTFLAFFGSIMESLFNLRKTRSTRTMNSLPWVRATVVGIALAVIACKFFIMLLLGDIIKISTSLQLFYIILPVFLVVFSVGFSVTVGRAAVRFYIDHDEATSNTKSALVLKFAGSVLLAAPVFAISLGLITLGLI